MSVPQQRKTVVGSIVLILGTWLAAGIVVSQDKPPVDPPKKNTEPPTEEAKPAPEKPAEPKPGEAKEAVPAKPDAGQPAAKPVKPKAGKRQQGLSDDDDPPPAKPRRSNQVKPAETSGDPSAEAQPGPRPLLNRPVSPDRVTGTSEARQKAKAARDEARRERLEREAALQRQREQDRANEQAAGEQQIRPGDPEDPTVPKTARTRRPVPAVVEYPDESGESDGEPAAAPEELLREDQGQPTDPPPAGEPPPPADPNGAVPEQPEQPVEDQPEPVEDEPVLEDPEPGVDPAVAPPQNPAVRPSARPGRTEAERTRPNRSPRRNRTIEAAQRGGEETAKPEEDGVKPEGGVKPGGDDGKTNSAELIENPNVVVPRPLPDDGRTEWFAFDGMPFEDVIAYFIQRIGKPALGQEDAIIGGDLTYTSTQRFTQQEAIDELNYLLLMQGYFLHTDDRFTYVLREGDIPKHLKTDSIYDGLEAFRAANLGPLEFVSVLIQIRDRRAEDVRDLIAPSMPDRALPVVVGEANKIRINGFAMDVERFARLLDVLKDDFYDPRNTKIFKIQTNAQVIEGMLRDFFELDSGVSRRLVQSRRSRTPQPAAQEMDQESFDTLKIIADTRTNSIIAKGTPEELKEVAGFIEQVDVKPEIGEFTTKVKEIQYADAEEVANLLNQIFEQEQGESRTPVRQVPQRGRRTARRVPNQQAQQNQANPEDIIVEDVFEKAKKTVRIVPDTRRNAIIVYATDDGHKRVDELLEGIDQRVDSNFQTFTLQHADATEIEPLVQQIAGGAGQQRGRGGAAAARGPSIVADPRQNALHVIAEREDMTRVAEVIRDLDLEIPDDQRQNRHVVELVNVTPSRVAQVINPILSGNATTSRSRGGRRGRAPVSVAPTSQVIPLDEAGLLIVICTDTEWDEDVEPVIRDLDAKAVSDMPVTHTFTIEKGNAQSIADTLDRFFRQYQHPTLGRSGSEITVTDNGDIMVRAVQPAIDEMIELVQRLDVEPDGSPLVIIPLAYANANELAQYAQMLLPEAARGQRRGGGGGSSGPSIEAEPATNSLIIRANSSTVEEVRAFVQDFEQRVSEQQPETRYYTLKFSNPREVATAITSLHGGGARGGRGRAPAESRVQAFDSGAQLVVEAPVEKFPAIEALIAKLDDPAGQDIVIKTIRLPGQGSSVSSIASRMNNAFRERARQQPNVIARFEADPTTETILVTASRSTLEEAERLLAEYQAIGEEIEQQIEFRTLEHASANDAANWLRDQLTPAVERQFGSTVARLIRVTGDDRTNRVILNAPQVAVQMGLSLLEQYDVESQGAPETPVEVKTFPVAGMDVSELARNLERVLGNAPSRPDRLRRVVSSDATTGTLIVSAPRDEFPEIERLVNEFVTKSEDVEPVRRTFSIVNADADYVAEQLRNQLNVRVGYTRGRAAASLINVSVDTRLNNVLVNAPRYAMAMAEELIGELDQVATRSDKIRTIALVNADATHVNTVLQQVLREKIRTKRTLQISVEPMTNSIIVSGADEDFEEIKSWATALDERAAESSVLLDTVELKNVMNPQELINVLNGKYNARQAGRKTNEFAFYAVGGGSTLVVQAPAARMEEVKQLVVDLDASAAQDDTPWVSIPLVNADPWDISQTINEIFGASRRGQSRENQLVQVRPSNGTLIVRAPEHTLEQIRALVEMIDKPDDQNIQIKTYDLEVLDATMVAMQVQFFLRSMGQNQRRGQLQPGAFAEPMTNTLIVMAPARNLPFIDSMIAKIEMKKPDSAEARSYDLKFAKADVVAQSLDQMLRAKAMERPGAARGGAQIPTSVVPDSENNRVVVFAPPQLQDLAVDLVEMMDMQSEGEITQIIEIESGSAEEIAQTVRETAGLGGGGGFFSGRGRGGRGFFPGFGSDSSVRVVADTGSNSVILSGRKDEIEKLYTLIKDLDTRSNAVPELQIFGMKHKRATQIHETLTAMEPFSDGGEEGVSIAVDEWNNRLIVSANKQKMRIFEGYLEVLDTPPSQDTDGGLGDREMHFIKIVNGDAFDIAYDVADLFPPESEGGPVIDSTWTGNMIKVICYPNEYAKIEQAVRKIESSLPPSIVIRRFQPKGNPQQLLQAMTQRDPTINVSLPAGGIDPEGASIVEPLWDDGEVPERIRRKRERAAPTGAKKDTTEAPGPTSSATRLGETGWAQFANWDGATPAAAGADLNQAADDTAAADVVVGDSQPTDPDMRTQVVALPDGSFIIKGPEMAVRDLEDMIDLIEEDLDEGEVIRIFEFRYGDVNSASRILDMMFNQRSAGRQPVRPQQQQNQRGQQGGDKGGEDERQQQQQQMLQQMMQQQAAAAAAGGGGSGVRIATDPGNNYLIVKCEASLLPEIRKLLRELDIPPGEVIIRLFRLENVGAEEAAEALSGALGLGSRQGGRSTRALENLRNRGGGAQIMDVEESRAVKIEGLEPAKIEATEIVPNAVSNTLLVSAPVEVMAVITATIKELEDTPGGVIVVNRYPLQNAKVNDVLPLLSELFSSVSGGAEGRGNRGGSPSDIGPVWVSGDARINAIVYSCRERDVPRVEEQIRAVDIEGAISEAETYVCKFGDAASIAETSQNIYVGGGSRGASRRGTDMPLTDVRVASDAVSNAIIVWGPSDARREILTTARTLDELSKSDVREIPVNIANPEKLADKLAQMFGGVGGSDLEGGSRRGGGARQVASMAGRVVVIGDQAAKKIFVRAPDHIFNQMDEMARVLDQDSMGLEIQNFPLKHARAEQVVTEVETAFAKYMMLSRQLEGGGGLDIDAFTAVPDPRTNSITVLGSQQTFAFVKTLLAIADVPTPDAQRKTFRVFSLQEANADVVAAAINNFAAGGGLEGAAAPRGAGGRSPMQMMSGGGGASGETLDVQAVAEPGTNSVLVFGIAEDIDKVDELIIQNLESSNRREIASFTVTNALASEIVSSISPYLLDEATGMNAAVVTPNDDGKKVIVWGTKAQVAKTERLILEFDSPDLQPHGVRVIQVPLGQDAASLAGRLQRVLNDGERSRAEATGRPSRTITIEADDTTNTLIVYGDPALYGMAEGVVRQLADIRPDDYQTVIIQLTNISSTEAADRINEMQNNRRGGGGGSGSSIRPTSGRSSGGSSVRPRSSRGAPRSAAPTPSSAQPTSVPRRSDAERGSRRSREPGRPRADAGAGGFGRFVGAMLVQNADEPNEPEPAPPAEVADIPPPTTTGNDSGPLQSISGQLRGDVVVTPIDSRQVMITGDRRDIEFVQQMLLLMEQASSAGDIRVFKLKNTTAAAIEPIITTAITEFIGTRTDSPDRGDRFSVIAESRSNSLIVTASERNMPWIEALIQRLDVDSQIGFMTRVRLVENLRATEAVALLEPILTRLFTNQGVPAAEQPSVTADARSNKIIIVGTEAHIEQVESLIDGIDVDIQQDQAIAAFSTGRILILPLKNNRAEDLAEVLNQMIQSDLAADNAQARQLRQLLLTLADGSELPPLNLDKPIRILPVPSSNSLMVFSSEENNNALREIVGVFDRLPEAHDIEIKSYRLEYAQAETVATLVQEMFDNGKKALMPPSESSQQNFERGVMPPQPPGMAPRGLPYNVVVQHEPRTNTVFVIGQTDAVLLAAGVIQELDRPSTEFRLQPEVIRLRQTQASQIAEQLTEVIDQRMQAMGVEANKARDGAILRADDRSNSLIVVAAPEMMQMVRDLATALDSADASQIVSTELLAMQKADAVKLASLLQQMFDRRRESERDVSPDGQKNILHVLADNRTNSLLLVGTRDYLHEAKMYISNLDRDAVPTMEVRLRPVLLGSAVSIAGLLQEMVTQSRAGQGDQSQGTPMYIAAEPYSNSLLLSAAREDMTQLERWIEILDKPLDPGGRVTKVIPVRRGDAEQLAQRAQEIYQVSGQQGAGSDVTVFHDPSTNAIVVVGPPMIVRDIESLLGQLDSAEASNNAVVKIYKLTQTDVELGGQLLRNILSLEAGTITGDGGGGAGGGSTAQESGSAVNLILASRPDLKVPRLPRGLRQNITVIDNTRTNEIVVIMPPESVELVDSLIVAIDQPPDSVPIRVIRLRNSDAEQMVTMLNELFERSQQQSGDQAAGTSDIAVIGAAAGRQELRFTTEPRTNSIVAAGTEGYLDLLEELVIQLDSVEEQPRQQIVYNPRYAPPAALREQLTSYNDGQQQILGELENQISATARIERQIGVYSADESNRLIVDFSPRRREEVLDLLNQLDQPLSQVMIEVLIVEVTVDNSLDLGVEFAFQDLQYTKAGPTDSTTFDFVGGTDLGAAGTGLGGFSFTITGKDFNFLLRTLQNEGSLNVLSRPQIVAMDGQLASINITNDVPYVTGTSTSVAGQVTTQVAREQIGIRLEVTPQINPDNFVRMEVRQEVSDLTDSTVDVGQGVTAPVFFRREAETTVSVRDAETVVLGGLITSRENRREQKIPILGDVPILGLFASSRTNETRRNELLLVLTPRVVRSVEDFRDVSVRARDESGILPPEVLSSRLMGNLRVRPELLAPDSADDTLGPFPGTQPPSPRSVPRNGGYDIPLGAPGTAPRLNDNAYQVPLTLQDQRRVKLTESNTLTPQQ